MSKNSEAEMNDGTNDSNQLGRITSVRGINVPEGLLFTPVTLSDEPRLSDEAVRAVTSAFKRADNSRSGPGWD